MNQSLKCFCMVCAPLQEGEEQWNACPKCYHKKGYSQHPIHYFTPNKETLGKRRIIMSIEKKNFFDKIILLGMMMKTEITT